MVSKFTRKDFLEALFSSYYAAHKGFILVQSSRNGVDRKSTRYFPTVDALAGLNYGDDQDVVMGVYPRERMKADREHIRYVTCLWAHLDIGQEDHQHKAICFESAQQAAKAIRNFPRAPSIIVESGHGAHLYWLLKEPAEVTDPENVEELLRKISRRMGSDSDVGLDATLRLPGTVNTRVPGRVAACNVKFINNGFRYRLEDFDNVTAPPKEVRAKKEPELPQVPEPPAAPAEPPSLPPRPREVHEPPSAPERTSSRDVLDIEEELVDPTIVDDLIDELSNPEASDIVLPPEDPVTLTPPIVPAPDSNQVEIQILGMNMTISGEMEKQEDGLVHVKSNGNLYRIPLTSIAFIKSDLAGGRRS